MKAKVNFILGAGFSFDAGLPLANDIKERLDGDVINKLVRMTSGEWKWEDTDGTFAMDGIKVSTDHMPYSFMLAIIVERYREARGAFIDYEDFYQWSIDSFDCWDFTNSLREEARSRMEVIYPSDKYEGYFYALEFGGVQSALTNLLSELISDLLIVRVEKSRLLHNYSSFRYLLLNCTKCNLFTLNHDSLLEILLNEWGFEFNNGFSTDGSPLIYPDEGIIQPVYRGHVLSEAIQLVKLHGGIGILKYPYLVQEGLAWCRTGEFVYWSPTSYHAKHYSARIDNNSGEVVQPFHSDITPQFLTGKNKAEIIANDYMYRDMYSFLAQELDSSDLYIIGYSFGDEHINERILNAMEEYKPRIINVNPSMNFPWLEYEKLEQVKVLSNID